MMSDFDPAAFFASVVIEISNSGGRAAVRVDALTRILPAYGISAAAHPAGGPDGRMTGPGGIRYARLDGPAASLAMLRDGALETLLTRMDDAVKTASTAYSKTLRTRGVREADRPRFRRNFRESYALAWGRSFAERAWSAAAGDPAPARSTPVPDFYGDQIHPRAAIDALPDSAFDDVAALRQAAAEADTALLAAHGATPVADDTPDDYDRPQPPQLYVEASAPRPMREGRWAVRFTIRADRHRPDIRHQALTPIIDTIGATHSAKANVLGQYTGHATGSREVAAVLHRHLNSWAALAETMAHDAVRTHLIPYLVQHPDKDRPGMLSAWRGEYLVAIGQAIAERIAAALARRADAARPARQEAELSVAYAAAAIARADAARLPAAGFLELAVELGAEPPRAPEPAAVLGPGADVAEYHASAWTPGRSGFSTTTVRIAVGPAGLLGARERTELVQALAEAFGIATRSTGHLQEGRGLLDRREVLDLTAPEPVIAAALAALPDILVRAEDTVVTSIRACEARLGQSEIRRRDAADRAMWRRFWANDVLRGFVPAFSDRLAAAVAGQQPPAVALWSQDQDQDEVGEELTGQDYGRFAVLGTAFDFFDELTSRYRRAWASAEPLPAEAAEDAAPRRPRVVIVPCGKKKATVATQAGAMYRSGYHTAARSAAAALTADGGTVLILSAKYGLLRLDEVIEPYELRAGDPGAITAEDLIGQAEALGITDAEVTALVPAAYLAMVRAVWPTAAAPLVGAAGIGYQLARFAAIAAVTQTVGSGGAPATPDTASAGEPASKTRRRRARNADKPRLHRKPLRFRQACEFVNEHHRHHKAPQGHLYSIGAADDRGRDVGAVIVGRPVARGFDDGWTAEVTRLVVIDQTPNTASMLLAAAWNSAKAMGYRRLITYTQADESGASLKGAGWRQVAHRPARGDWNTPSRPRADTGTAGVERVLWEITCHPAEDREERVSPAHSK